MKKVLLLCIVMCFLLCGCVNNPATDNETKNEESTGHTEETAADNQQQTDPGIEWDDETEPEEAQADISMTEVPTTEQTEPETTEEASEEATPPVTEGSSNNPGKPSGGSSYSDGEIGSSGDTEW